MQAAHLGARLLALGHGIAQVVLVIGGQLRDDFLQLRAPGLVQMFGRGALFVHALAQRFVLASHHLALRLVLLAEALALLVGFVQLGQRIRQLHPQRLDLGVIRNGQCRRFEFGTAPDGQQRQQQRGDQCDGQLADAERAAGEEQRVRRRRRGRTDGAEDDAFEPGDADQGRRVDVQAAVARRPLRDDAARAGDDDGQRGGAHGARQRPSYHGL